MWSGISLWFRFLSLVFFFKVVHSPSIPSSHFNIIHLPKWTESTCLQKDCFVVVIQLLNHVLFFVTPWTAACQTSLSFTISQNLLKLRSIESEMPFNYLILCHPLLLLPSIFPRIRVFSNESALHIRWPKYWSFRFSISSSNEHSGLISFRINSPCCPRDSQEFSPAPQFERISSSALSRFCGPTLTFLHDYWKNHSFDYMDFGGKVMTVLFNMLSRLVITFLPRSQHLLISRLRSLSTMILETNKSLSLFSFFPHIFSMQWWGQMPWSSFFECWDFKPTYSLSSVCNSQNLGGNPKYPSIDKWIKKFGVFI